MNVEFTGRHYEVTPAIRKEIETGLSKIRRILGDRFETHVILAVEKHRNKAEITITPRNGPLVGLAQANDMSIAMSEALDHLEKQAVKYKSAGSRKDSQSAKAKKQESGTANPPRSPIRTKCRKPKSALRKGPRFP